MARMVDNFRMKLLGGLYGRWRARRMALAVKQLGAGGGRVQSGMRRHSQQDAASRLTSAETHTDWTGD